MSDQAHWLRGRKQIGNYLDVSVRRVSFLRLQGAPIVFDGIEMCAKSEDLDAWQRSRDVGRCPITGVPCPRIGEDVPNRVYQLCNTPSPLNSG